MGWEKITEKYSEYIDLFDKDINPLFFIGSLTLVHSIIAIFSKKDPQLGQIISAKLNLFAKKIPGKLAA